MNLKVFILAAATIGVGLVELIVGGILPVMADDLQVNLGTAGQLISVFALIYAISGPVLLSLTAKIERKRLYLIALFIFFLGNVMTYFSPNFLLVMVARVITAMSTALVVVLSLTITAKIVEPAHRAKALGFIYMGISSSLVLGVPIGIIITDHFGWRTIFLGIAFLSLMSIVFISLFLERIPTERVQPLSVQIKSLGNIKIASAHLATMFMLAGHYTLYAYFTPFLETAFHLNQNWISICYFLFGLSAICGGALGGALADRIGSQKSILLVISSFAIVLFLLPYSTFSFPLFLVAMMLWGALSWSLAPPQQNYIIQIDPDASDIQQSINNSALQIGISLGSAIGGVVLAHTSSLISTAHVGAGVVVIALICGIISLTRSSGIDQAEM
ncbi:DHA1 family purine base/nucleoside efflux pump-like MFS transporter [Bacillus thermophilus]|uniref:DHA1 family purine base/nucleoside efflux pump-like MFS transporter n=1 Tax=Siminovitchia thermophila TaxID=1245522 RepID=A0ABS2RA15_9BACI|nr:MFS transporter [Siminovitchia thermophila]MBM7715708.1 DHA1 family purine base/nucleoside efflux pump-like MFS transporter [Siminovitchia thermophila]ONK25209.1 MFS transporter [Bacillus sp. VT-16-64]